MKTCFSLIKKSPKAGNFGVVWRQLLDLCFGHPWHVTSILKVTRWLLALQPGYLCSKWRERRWERGKRLFLPCESTPWRETSQALPRVRGGSKINLFAEHSAGLNKSQGLLLRKKRGLGLCRLPRYAWRNIKFLGFGIARV